jgi:hypothetical protein
MVLEEHEIESFRQSSIVSIFPLLRNGIFHRTGTHGYKGIKKEGFIFANKGQYECSYPQSTVYYGPTMGYVCLFDFESATEEEIICIHPTWEQFFSDHRPVTISLRLNREKLGSELIANSSAPKIGDENYRGYIPFIEAWYPKPIPISAIDSYLVTMLNPKFGELIYEEYPVERIDELDEALGSIEEKWNRLRGSKK